MAWYRLGDMPFAKQMMSPLLSIRPKETYLIKIFLNKFESVRSENAKFPLQNVSLFVQLSLC